MVPKLLSAHAGTASTSTDEQAPTGKSSSWRNLGLILVRASVVGSGDQQEMRSDCLRLHKHWKRAISCGRRAVAMGD